MKRKNGAAALAGATALAVVSYQVFFRRKILTWGASAEEIGGKLPGDDLLPDARLVTTRAVKIQAPPGAVWPWLAQMGSGRGGAYTYDWIENLLGLDMHSADTILPQFQQIKAGDEFPLGPGRPAFRVEVSEPGKALVFRYADGNWVWSFALIAEAGTTRLVSRNRIVMPGASPVNRLFTLMVMEPGSLVMERKMLLGIKKRAEHLAREQDPGAARAAATSG